MKIIRKARADRILADPDGISTETWKP
jgi:hypothetical protein